MAKARVWWTDEEKADMVNVVFTLRQHDPEAPLLTILNRAQKQLPEDRRRKIVSISSVPWLADEIKLRFKGQRNRLESLSKFKEQAKQAEQDIEQAQLIVDEEINRRKEELEGLHRSKIEHLERIQNELPDIKELRQEALAGMNQSDLLIEFIKRHFQQQDDIILRLSNIEKAIFNLKTYKVSSTPTKTHKTATKPKSEPVLKKKILIVGLLAGQEQEIKTSFGSRAALIFLDKDKSKAYSSSNYPDCDRCFVTAKFISHKVVNAVTNRYSSAMIETYHGGITGLRERIENYLPTQSKRHH